MRTLTAFILSAIILHGGTAPAGTRIEFSSLDKDQNYRLSGTLYLPDPRPAPCAAIVLVHGTAGINVTGAFYRESVLRAGVAIFEVDFKTGIFTSPLDRPKLETFVPMSFAALKELRKLPSIDPKRIGIMGFSLGGGVTLRTAVEANRKLWMKDEPGFAVFVGFYPVAKGFIPILEKSGSRLTGAPMIVLYGTNDVYGDGTAVPELKSLLARKYKFELTTVEYPGAAHDFNRNSPPLTYADPAARGGKGYTAWDGAAANDSLIRLVDFLQTALSAK